LIISPYAKSNYVDHTQYEFGSILKFIEEVFPNVKRLGRTKEGYTDTRANSLDNAFNFTQAPRAFQKIKQKYPVSHFLHGMPVNEPPDKD
jgi:phospholipase C